MQEGYSVFNPLLAEWDVSKDQNKKIDSERLSKKYPNSDEDSFDKLRLTNSNLRSKFLLPKMDFIKLKNPFIPSHEEITARYSKIGI